MLENEKKVSGLPSADRLYNEFKNATLAICSDLKINEKDVEISRFETPKLGVDYTSSSSGEPLHFFFHLRTVTKEMDVTQGKMTVALDVYSSEGDPSFDFYEEIKDTKWHTNFLQRWISKAISKFNDNKLSDNLESLFHNSEMRIYGMPNSHTPTIQELTVFLNGIVSYVNKLIVYRFRHVREIDMYRQFSYAFLVSSGVTPLWIFFLNVGSPDSGGAKHDFDYIENQLTQISKTMKVELRDRDIEYGHLEKYLIQHSTSFEKDLIPSIYQHSIFDNVDFSMQVFGEALYDEYEKMKKHYESGDYMTALREIRPIIQEALMITCSKNNVDITDMNSVNVSNLVGKLIGAKLLDGSNQKWVEAFAHEPNQSVHRIYPTQDDLEKIDVKERIKLSFQVAIYILTLLYDLNELGDLDELDETIRLNDNDDEFE